MIRLSGRFRSALIIGLQGIRARKMRTFLSMISLFLGVLAVVTVQAAAETARTMSLADVELHMGRDGTRTMYVPPIGSAVDVTMATIKDQPGVAASFVMQAIIGEPKVRPINPGAAPFDRLDTYGGGYGPGTRYEMQCDQSGACRPVPVDEGGAAPPGAAIEMQLVAMVNDIRQFRPFRSVSGSWLDFSGKPSYSPRVVINKAAAVGFGRYRIPAEMRLDGAIANPTPRIIGVIDDGNEQPMAYARADEINNWLPPPAAPDATGPVITDGPAAGKPMMIGNGPGLEVMLTPTAGETESLLTRKLIAAGVPREALNVGVIDARKHIEQQLKILRWIFLSMATLVLLIGVAGILNVGLATVGERVEEFALRRAVGTPRVLLAGIVLAETLLTGLLTAGAAIAVAAAGVNLGGRILGERVPQLHDMTFPWQAGVAGVIAGLIAGLLGGSIPAFRAARIPIATVMRA
ncbi:FtsX-like permease family protein [Dactylosporangium sp. NPDC048998]|uniref:ABC transporter permease n=1 Tax=Dactylosporangium sp. NPDC048998 TaxID=3363976 RepID=UPI0037107AEA